MKLFIDGIESGWEYMDSATLEDVIVDAHTRLLQQEKRLISEIKIDEADAGLDMDLTPAQVSIDKIVKMSLSTCHVSEATLANLDEAEIKFTESRIAIAKIIDDILGDRIDEAMNRLRDELDVMIGFFNILQQANVAGIVDFDIIKVGDDSLLDFIGHFNSTLGELVNAMKNNDMTLINDYLEYELEPAIGKILGAMPQMKESIKGTIGK